MNIQPTSQNNPNFEKLYAPKKLKMFRRNISRKQLLEMPLIRDNMEKYDIFFKPETKRELGLRRDISAILGFGAMTGMGISCGLLYLITKNLEQAMVSGIGGGAIGMAGALILAFQKPFRQSCFDYQVFGQKKYSDGTEIKTEPIKLFFSGVFETGVEQTVKQLKDANKFVFLQTISKNYPENGDFDAKSILKILESENIKKDFANGEAFNYKIDVNGRETLLTKFAALSKNEENTKEYDKIISIIKSTPNVDFHQKDAAGISILENILNMENSKALELVKDIEFEHTDYLDSLFNNIQDENFKAQAKKLKIKFKDPVKILQETKRLKDFEEAALVQLNSPFCDTQKVGFDLWQRVFVLCQNQKDILSVVNRILYNYLPENLRMDV